MTDWDKRFIDLAEHIASWSKDSTKVGAVIVYGKQVLATGYNGFPPGVDESIEARHERPAKYMFTEHAERNAIYFAACKGTPLQGTTLYVTAMPCADCARGVIRAGIATVYYTRRLDTWQDSHNVAIDMFEETGVKHGQIFSTRGRIFQGVGQGD